MQKYRDHAVPLNQQLHRTLIRWLLGTAPHNKAAQMEAEHCPMCTELSPSPYLIEQLHQRWQQSTGDQLLDLLARPGCNIAECPCCLLLYSWLRVSQQKGQDSQDTSINSCLGLLISPCNHIPNGTQSWSLDRD